MGDGLDVLPLPDFIWQDIFNASYALNFHNNKGAVGGN